MERLDKFLTLAVGISRSDAKNYLTKGWVTVNGQPVKKGDIKIDITKDIVEVNNQRVGYDEHLYYMLNKPAGYVSATEDNVNKTIISLFDPKEQKRLFPVGRLDIDTEGLIIVTNDGALSHHLTSPKHEVDKKYLAHLEGIPSNEGIHSVESGIELSDFVTKPGQLKIIEKDDTNNTSKVIITISEGKFHQVKRMMHAIGCEVVYLKRIAIGDLKLDESLETGGFRQLTDDELDILRR